MKPFGVISDTHHHNWTAFSSTNGQGVNTRLHQILAETQRCAVEVVKAGGNTIIHGGDLFHVRGSVAPSVLNPTLELYHDLIKSGMRILINAGNHDLEGKEATKVGSAITALEKVGCQVVNEPMLFATDGLVLVPYMQRVADLKVELERLASTVAAGAVDLVIHAGIDGVIKGLPDHGLDATYLSKLGFRRIFAGHYHHHKQLAENVWSIGALTHQTWSDIGSKAGFLIVTDEGVNWRSTHAPSFVEIDGATNPDDIPLIVDGNYVRAKIFSSKASEIEALRQFLTDSGAKGVTIVSQPPTGVTRTKSTVTAGASIEVSVTDFIKASDFSRPTELAVLCDDILKDAKESA
jgi:DNA repair exonuclease SbcCD nuclease subunit